MTAAGTTSLPVWGVVAVWAYIGYRFLSGARTEERRRLEEGQPRTKRDNALLLLTALSVVGVLLLCAFFIKPLSVLVSSRVGIAAIILVVGGGLTFIFNRKGTPHE